MTYAGGADGLGTIFSEDIDGTNFTLLHSFAGGPGDGANPIGDLLLSGSTLYGMTLRGGSSNLLAPCSASPCRNRRPCCWWRPAGRWSCSAAGSGMGSCATSARSATAMRCTIRLNFQILDRAKPGSGRTLWMIALKLTSSLLVAVLSWNLIEQPFLNLKNRFGYGRQANASPNNITLKTECRLNRSKCRWSKRVRFVRRRGESRWPGLPDRLPREPNESG